MFADYPKIIEISGIKNRLIHGHRQEVKCRVTDIRPFPKDMYWVYRGNRVYRQLIFEPGEYDIRSFRIEMTITIMPKIEMNGSSLTCVIEMLSGKSIKYSNMINVAQSYGE